MDTDGVTSRGAGLVGGAAGCESGLTSVSNKMSRVSVTEAESGEVREERARRRTRDVRADDRTIKERSDL